MVNFLYWNGVKEAEQLLNFWPIYREDNQLLEKTARSGTDCQNVLAISDQVFMPPTFLRLLSWRISSAGSWRTARISW
jgi:hypothetical protein